MGKQAQLNSKMPLADRFFSLHPAFVAKARHLFGEALFGAVRGCRARTGFALCLLALVPR